MVEPYITREAVSAALNALIHETSSTDKFSGLLQLQLVALAIQSPEFPSIELPEAYALQSILSETIIRQLDYLRRLFHLPATSESYTFEQIHAIATQETQINNTDLTGWSAIYHRYILPFTLSPGDIAHLYGMDERTYRRYLGYGIKLLTRQLAKIEQTALQDQRQIRLSSQLPTRGKSPLFGRDDLVKQIQRICLTGDLPHILITGLSGIGKTSLVEKAVKVVIDQDIVERLIWISHCPSIEQVSRMILANLRVEEAIPSLRPTLAVYRTLIVLDDAAPLFSDVHEIELLLDDLADAIVIIICDEYSLIPSTVRHHFRLGELEFAPAKQLVEDAFKVRGDITISSEIASDLYNAFGGHPLALRVAAAKWDDLDWSLVEHDVVQRMLASTFERLALSAQMLWCAMALNGKGQCCLADFAVIWGQLFSTGDVNVLASYMLITHESGNCYAMIDAAKLFIRSRYVVQEDIRRPVDELLWLYLESSHSRWHPSVMVEIATNDWVKPSADHVEAWVLNTWHANREILNPAEWLTLFEFAKRCTGELSVELEIANAICLRRLGELDSAAQVFTQIVARCGREGRFREQAIALVEWSLVTSLIGNYGAAQELLNQASRSKLAQQDKEFRRHILLISAQLSIEKLDGKTAFDQLRHLAADSEVLALLAESCLLVNDVKLALHLAEEGLVRLSTGNLPLRVRLCTIIGRCCERNHQLDSADRYFAEALLCAQRLGDRFSIARAQSNLAAVLMERRRYIDAHEMLSQAESVQEKLGDMVGLQISAHNRELLERRVAG